MPTPLTVTCPADFVEFPTEAILQGIHQRFEEQVRRHPNHIAIRTRGAVLTYPQMNGFANSLAAQILSVTGTALAQAAILYRHTPDVIVSMLASLKAHKAYVLWILISRKSGCGPWWKTLSRRFC